MPAAVIARDLDLPRAATYRILGALEDHGYAVHYPEAQRYGLGFAAFELSSGFSRQEPITRLSAPILASMVDRLGESAHVAVLSGTDVIYLVEERAKLRPALITEVGVRLPSHATASGRAMLATLPLAQVRALFADKAPFATRPHHRIRSLSGLARELIDVRRAGYATESEEVTPGMASVSVAARDHAGWPAACLTLTFPLERIAPSEWPALAGRIRTYTRELERRIGSG